MKSKFLRKAREFLLQISMKNFISKGVFFDLMYKKGKKEGSILILIK